MSTHVADRLSAYLDRELSVAEAGAVREHLAGCEACATHLAHLAAVDGQLRSLPVVSPAGYFDSFSSRVRSRIEAAPGRRTGFRLPVWSWAVAAAVLVAIILPRMAQSPVSPTASPREVPPTSIAAVAAPTPEPPRAEAQAQAVPAEAARLRSLGYVEPSAGLKAQRGGSLPAAATPPPTLTPGPPASPKREAENAFAAPPPAAPAPTVRTAQAPASLAESAKAAGHSADKIDAAGAAAAETAAAGLRDEARAPVAQPAPHDLEKDNRQDKDLQLAEEPGVAAPAGGRADEAKKSRRTAATGTLAQAPASLAETEYRRLEAGVAGTPLTAQREAWRVFALRHPEDPRADEARVRVVSLGVDLARQTGTEGDRSRALKDGADYLARKDAAQKERVRSLLEGLAP